MIFSDETQVVVGNDRRIYVWRKPDELHWPEHHANTPCQLTTIPVHPGDNKGFTNMGLRLSLESESYYLTVLLEVLDGNDAFTKFVMIANGSLLLSFTVRKMM